MRVWNEIPKAGVRRLNYQWIVFHQSYRQFGNILPVVTIPCRIRYVRDAYANRCRLMLKHLWVYIVFCLLHLKQVCRLHLQPIPYREGFLKRTSNVISRRFFYILLRISWD